MPPVITTAGLEIGHILGGSVIIEAVFSWPGIGRLTIEAVKQRDTITVTGCIIMSVIMISIIQLIVDITYAFVDPRLKSQYARSGKRRKKGGSLKEVKANG
jgi:peptide/nickel transport system permease protein